MILERKLHYLIEKDGILYINCHIKNVTTDQYDLKDAVRSKYLH